MKSLKDRLIERIRTAGPITLAEYMASCLTDPDEGYYTTSLPIGAGGDFVTAPEVSQMFGELLGLALAQAWLDQGQPSPSLLIELGPGRGTLMADILRAASVIPGFSDAVEVCLVEASPTLRLQQAEALRPTIPSWFENLADVPEGPVFLIANEFFDALPIRQFQRKGPAWVERLIGFDGESLTLGLSPPVAPADLEHRLGDTFDGEIVETSPASLSVAQEIGRRIDQFGGAAIVVDYGDWRSKGDTFQAMSGHAYTDPLASPGKADLTAHVDFQALSEALAPAVVSKMTTQGLLLARLGIEGRATSLAKGMNDKAQDALEAAFHRLTAHDQMGTLFKAIAAYPRRGPIPPGFDQ